MSDTGKLGVLLVSLGQLNELLLKLLARSSFVREIVVATRNVSRALPALNLARMAAGAEEFFPILRAVSLDFNQTEPAAEALAELRPEVTFAAPSLQSWWVLDRLPPPAAEPLRAAGFGAWLPFHLAPMIRLMRAWRESGLSSPIISAPYPDVVNPILSFKGLAPTCGAGNLDEIVPKLRWRVGEELSVSPEEVRVRLVGHHALEKYVYRSSPTDELPPPYLLRIEIGGRKLGDALDAPAMLFEPYPLSQGLEFHHLTAGSALRLLGAFGAGPKKKIHLHVPAPHGLPGGYPVVVEDGRVELDLAPEWTRQQAVEVNRASHRWDGIESLEPDGTVVFTGETSAVLRENLAFDFPRLRFEDVEAAAEELRRRFQEYIRRLD